MPDDRSRRPFDNLLAKGFDLRFVSHAEAILRGDFPEALAELGTVLDQLALPVTEIIGSGGGETKFTQRLRRSLASLGWRKHVFEIGKTIDGLPRESTSHEVDHVKSFGHAGVIACEIEWNDKAPFFDRDPENFKRLHAEGAISVGVITRFQLSGLHVGLDCHFAGAREVTDFDSLAAVGVTPAPKRVRNVKRRVEGAKDAVDLADAWTDAFAFNKFGYRRCALACRD